jgi:heat shock protein HslJ
MRVNIRGARVTAALLLLLTAACARPPRDAASAADFRRTVSGADWEVTELAGQPAPEGAGGRPATLVFDADSARAGGFSGCNSYGGAYTVNGSELRFGQLVMTKMACERGMELESGFMGALERTAAYELVGNELVLRDASGVVVRLRRAGA